MKANETPYVPLPTGPHAVGITTLHLEDSARADPWMPEVGVRELMVSVWYPAVASDGEPASYMTPRESELLLGDFVPGVPGDLLSRTRTNAVVGAEPAGGGWPLVVLSPGFTKPRCTLSALAEELASHGYVVAAVDHTYENVATTFPDGRVTTCTAGNGERGPEFWATLTAGRAADVGFVLDELTGPWSGAALIDADRIAMVGHSAGGASAPSAMVADERILAGVDIDGTISRPLPDTGLARPFLFLGKASSYTPGVGPSAGTWAHDWQRLTGWRRWLLVVGAVHVSFSDIGLLAEQCGIGRPAPLSAARGTEITRRFVRAFLDLHLLGRPAPLLDGPSADHPEVGFHHGDHLA